MITKQAIRADKRQQRRALSPVFQSRNAELLATIVSRETFFLRSRHLAFYIANDGELDPAFLLSLSLAAGKNTYLPVLDGLNGNRLNFLPYEPGVPMVVNRYGIPEPDRRRHKRRAPWTLDVVFMPLVAFDRQGHRLGMGGGFYDRTFARYNNSHGPLLVGIAHSFQEVENLPAEPWDIPLHAIATEQELIRIN